MKVKINPFVWLGLGLVLMVMVHMTVSVELLAWVAYVPFLLYLHQTRGRRFRWWFILIYLLSWSIIVAKIITDPIPLMGIPLYALPIALFHLPAFLVWARFREKKYAWLLFPALMTVMEWVQYTYTPWGAWGAAAYTQMDNINMLQTVSLFGMAGLSFLIYIVNIGVSFLITNYSDNIKKVSIIGVLFLAVSIFSAVRYDFSKLETDSMIKVAAVGTDSEIGSGPLPTDEDRRKNVAALFDRTRQAAKSQAELIVWNEAAALVYPEEENEWKDRLSTLAADCGATLVASYIVLVSEKPMKYGNKYLFITPNGEIIYSYLKHEPVPGEPAIKGKEPFEAHQVNGVNYAGAICYDYDFPYLARAIGKQKADIVALPSSDWRGIDPIHTKMAAFRAVEQGHSVLRSTRFGLSAAINPYGEMQAQMSSFDDHDKIMVAHLPKTKVTTLYSLVGDVFVYLCMGFAVWFWLPVSKALKKG